MSVLVILEAGHRMAAEALTAGRQFAQTLGTSLTAATIDAGTPYTADGFTAAYEAHARAVSPSLVVFAHTYQTRDWAPKLATRFGKVLISDVIAARLITPSEG